MIRRNIPNLITSFAILSGSIAVILAVEGILTGAVFFIFLAAVFDFLDGMAARLLGAYSELGKQLDSLSDMISFGLAPGVIVFSLQKIAVYGDLIPLGSLDIGSAKNLLLLSALIIPVFAAIRLAKFNIDERQSTSFIGMPTPAGAIFFASLALIHEHGKSIGINSFLFNPIALLILTLAISFLMVSEIPMFSLKLSNLSWKDNKIRFIFAGLVILLISFLGIYGIPIAIVAYIILSAISSKIST